jgi:peptidoglycan hydrolase-like protein with peptidoglycan-binding domain
VPQKEVLLLPRIAALVVAILAVLVLATNAFAQSDTATGGTTAESQPAKPKKVTVKQIQKALGIKADGVMGPKTRRALKRFQKRHGLKADGIAGPATLQALGLAGAPKSSSLAATQPVNPDDVAAVLAKIADCESGGNPTAVSASGTYRGKYQFSQETWESLGGTGDPAEADENVQDMYAAGLYQQRGLAPWPACSAQVQAQLDPAAPVSSTN